MAGIDERLAAIERRLDAIEAALGIARAAAPPAPAPSPPAAGRPPPPRPGPQVDLEELLGGRVLAWVGGVAVVLGAVFFLVMAVSRGWIDEPTRTVLAFAGSTALLGLGVWLYEARGQTDAAVAAVSAAVAALYAAVTTATQVYDLVAPGPGLLVAAVVGAAATAIAVRWERRLIAALGIVGALLSPVLVDAGTSGVSLAFMALALVSATGVLVWRSWDWLAVLAYLVSAPQLLAWLADRRDGPAGPTLAALALFWALYVAAAVGYELRVPTARLRPSSGGLLIAGALLAAGAGWWLLDGRDRGGWATAWVTGVAVAHVVLGVSTRRGRVSREIALVLLAVAVGLSAVALALALDGPALVASWSAEAVLLTWLAATTGIRRGYLAAGAFLVLAAGHVLLLDAPPAAVAEPRGGWTPTVAVALVAVALLACRLLYRGGWPYVRASLAAASVAALAYLPAVAFQGGEVPVTWAALAAAVAAYGRWRADEDASWAATALAGLAALHVISFEAPPRSLVDGVDDLGAAAVAIAAVAAAALAAARLATRRDELAQVLAALALLYLPSVAIVDVTSTGDVEPGQTPQVLLSVFWSVVGLAAIVYGLVRDARAVRLAGLGLLGVTAVKVFLYDLSALESAYRALSFVALGLLLLAGAYAYQRLRAG